MQETYSRLKKMVGQTTEKRLNIIDEEIRKTGEIPLSYELDSPRGKDNHLAVQFNFDKAYEIWFSANYDTYEELPAANNNTSSVVALLGLIENIKNAELPINLRLTFFDAGLDTNLITKKKRNPEFKPGSEILLQHLIDTETEFIETYAGAIIIQAVGKGNLTTFKKTGKKSENSSKLNNLLITHGNQINQPVSLLDQSPNADNLPFLNEGLEATVLARYHEGSWHRMQTKDDDLSNVNVQTIDETIFYLSSFIQTIDLGNLL